MICGQTGACLTCSSYRIGYMALLKPNGNYQSCCLCILLSVHQSVSISYAQIYIKSLMSCPIHFPCPNPEAVDRRTHHSRVPVLNFTIMCQIVIIFLKLLLSQEFPRHNPGCNRHNTVSGISKSAKIVPKTKTTEAVII